MRVLIVDDHELFIDGLCHILKKIDDGLDVVKCTRAESAIDILDSNNEFDLILVDLRMPEMDGMSVLQRMQKRNALLPVVVISAEENFQTIKSSLDAGALGFIPKSHSSKQMLSALESVLEGEVYIPADIEQELNRLEIRRSVTQHEQADMLNNYAITKRQFDVLQLLLKGYSNKQIATTLFLTEHTVKAHLSALFSALNAKNRTECVQKALSKGILLNPEV